MLQFSLSMLMELVKQHLNETYDLLLYRYSMGQVRSSSMEMNSWIFRRIYLLIYPQFHHQIAIEK